MGSFSLRSCSLVRRHAEERDGHRSSDETEVIDDTHAPSDDATSPEDEASYVCASCGEEIVVPIDVSAGSSQEYVEDCPVCCRPHLLRVEVDVSGRARIDARAE